MRGIALSIFVVFLVACSFSQVSDRFTQNVTSFERDGQTVIEQQWLLGKSGQPLLKVSLESNLFSQQDLQHLASSVARTVNYKLGIYHFQPADTASGGAMVRESECIECTIHRF